MLAAICPRKFLKIKSMNIDVRNLSPLSGIMLLALFAASGCQSLSTDSWGVANNWNLRKAVGLEPTEPDPPQLPTRLVSTWTDTTLHKSGQKAERGFGGRLLFFNGESEEPIRIAGELVVYAFDETNRPAHDTRPTRKFVFPAQQFVRHESPSKLGPYYSVWLPWDEVGGPMKNVSLIARFEPSGGPMVIGEQTRHLLPGTTTAATIQSTTDEPPIDYMQAASQIRQGQFHQDQKTLGKVQLASAEFRTEQKQLPSSLKKRMTTSTIRLPSKWK